jgi:hypothetical protein
MASTGSRPRSRTTGGWVAATGIAAALAVVALGGQPTAAGARAGHRAAGATCVVHSLHSFMAQSSNHQVADVIRVGCTPEFAGRTVRLSDEKPGCKVAFWTQPAPASELSSGAIEVRLDYDGNATAVLAGVVCSPTTSTIEARLTSAPFTTFTTTFKTVADKTSAAAVLLSLPSAEVEEGIYGSAATIGQAELPVSDAGKSVMFSSVQLYSDCSLEPHLRWIVATESGLATVAGPSAVTTVDAKGNAFAVALAGPGCVAGRFVIEASLTSTPFTSYIGTFTLEAPRPMA